MPTRDGAWRTVKKPLIPGYVFVEAADHVGLRKGVGTLPPFPRMLGVSDDSFLPLTNDEVVWISSLFNVQNVVQMSHGVIEGEKVTVTEGPSRVARLFIAKIDRHKRVAYLRVHMLGREKLVKVGLEIVRES